MMKTPKKNYALPKAFLRQFGGKITALADMRRYTSWRIGGAADWLVEPETEADVLAVMELCGQSKLPLTVIGRGTNLLVSDAGIAGVVMRIGEKFSAVEYMPENRVWVSAGALLAAVSKETAAKSLSGLEWACGIPGNIGGALMMNAGAYGSCMADVVTEVKVAAYTGTEEKKAVLRTIAGDELCFGGYRSGCIAGDMVALSAVLQLAEGDAETSLAQIRETIATRAKNQPLEYPSAGSVFRNPEGSHAGYLVEQTGCKGWQVGGAQVSEKHGNFIINLGDATANDVLTLIKRVQAHVLQQTGYTLETEVRLLGRDSD